MDFWIIFVWFKRVSILLDPPVVWKLCLFLSLQGIGRGGGEGRALRVDPPKKLVKDRPTRYRLLMNHIPQTLFPPAKPHFD